MLWPPSFFCRAPIPLSNNQGPYSKGIALGRDSSLNIAELKRSLFNGYANPLLHDQRGIHVHAV